MSLKIKIYSRLYSILFNAHKKNRYYYYKEKYKFSNTVLLGDVILQGDNISIGENTYINSGQLVSGVMSKVKIGNWCAIGHNVKIVAVTHDTLYSTGPENERPRIEKDIIIGNNVWIGSNVFIKEGVNINDNSIIGANSLVAKDVMRNEIVGEGPL